MVLDAVGLGCYVCFLLFEGFDYWRGVLIRWIRGPIDGACCSGMETGVECVRATRVVRLTVTVDGGTRPVLGFVDV